MNARPIRRFTEVLGLLDRGRFEEACDQALTEALETLESLPKEAGKATMTVSLTISYDRGRVDVKPELKSKLPESVAFGNTPFWAHGGALSTQHPSQTDMFVRETPRATASGE